MSETDDKTRIITRGHQPYAPTPPADTTLYGDSAIPFPTETRPYPPPLPGATTRPANVPGPTPTRPVGTLDAPTTPHQREDPDKTRPIDRKPADDNPTILLRPRPQDPLAAMKAPEMTPDPVTGWLVVVKGPGMGHAVQIGYGRNSIGRAQGQRVRLDFGDEEISRTGQAYIAYDGKNRKFFLTPGESQNLIYLGQNPVLMPVELFGGECFIMGQTVVKFIPLCGPGFDWEESLIHNTTHGETTTCRPGSGKEENPRPATEPAKG